MSVSLLCWLSISYCYLLFHHHNYYSDINSRKSQNIFKKKGKNNVYNSREQIRLRSSYQFLCLPYYTDQLVCSKSIKIYTFDVGYSNDNAYLCYYSLFLVSNWSSYLMGLLHLSSVWFRIYSRFALLCLSSFICLFSANSPSFLL